MKRSDDVSPTDEHDHELLVFPSFFIDRRGGRLVRAGGSVRLRPKTWAVLLYLSQRPGVLVRKEELLDAIWPGVAVTPDTLTKSIGELRAALGDDSKAPTCIETVHRRGFRFIAEIPAPGSKSLVPGFKDERETKDLEPETGDHEPGTRFFVGRTAELRQLETPFVKACAGERQIVFVTGVAGAGKTALVETFIASLAAAKVAVPVWIGRGASVEQHGSREAYMPVLSAVEQLAHRPDAAVLVGLLRRTAPTWLAQIPWLLGDNAEAVRQSLQITSPERMPREFASLIAALTTDIVLVLVLEDLHWSDPSTVDLLLLLAQRRDPARLLVIATYRPTEVTVHEHPLARAVPALLTQRRCVELPVHPLRLVDVQTYLGVRFPGARFPPELARLLHDHTGGDPLFLIGVVDHMLSRGWILETAPGWALATAFEKIELGVPDNARRMIERQFEDLSPSDRTLLEAASVSGLEFAVQGIAPVLECDAAIAELGCERLARTRRFLRPAGCTEWPDGSIARRYAFTHELFRQVVYAGIPDGQRQRLHQRIGAAVETAHGERAVDVAALLAMHFERGRDFGRALRYLAATAASARQRYANREAIGCLEHAIGLAARLQDTTDQHRAELELRIALAPALNDIYGFAAGPTRANCERAYELCTQWGTPEQQFQVLYAWCHISANRSDATLVPRLAAELDELAGRLGTREYRLLASAALVRIAAGSGNFVIARRLVEQRLTPERQQTHHRRASNFGVDPLIGADCHFAIALWFLGDVERATHTMQASLAAAQAGGSPFTQSAALSFGCFLEVLRRNLPAACALAHQAIELSAEHGFPSWNAIALALRGWIWVQQGKQDEGIAALERARTVHAATGARMFSTHILAFLAEAHLRSGAIHAALTAVDEGLAVAETTLDRMNWSELWRIKGEVLLAASRVPSSPTEHRTTGNKQLPGDSDAYWRAAEGCLLQAVHVARQAEAKSLELRAATSLARAWRERDRSAEAHAALHTVCEWFPGTTDTADLAEARAVLGTLSPATRRRRRPACRRQRSENLRKRPDDLGNPLNE